MPAFQRQLANKTGSNAYQTQAPSLTAKGDPRQFVKHNYTDHSPEHGDVNYADRYNLVCHERDNTQKGEDGTSCKVAKIPQSPTFPLKLHMILDEIEESDSDLKKSISWLPHGRAFHIRNGDIFKRVILARYFKSCKMSSFYRQINLYGFVRLTTGCETGTYYHEYFLRGRAFLTQNIIRTKVKGTKIRPTNAPRDEPNFYAMLPVGPRQRSIRMPLEALPDSNRSESSIALVAAMREVERINYANAESQNFRYNVQQNIMQSASLGGMASPPEPASHPSLLSYFNLDGYLANNLRAPHNGIPRTINRDMTRAAALQNELSRTALQNETSRIAARTEMARDVMHNELSRAAIHNETTQAMHNEISRNGYNEMPRMVYHNEIPQMFHNEFQRATATSTLATGNSMYHTEEMKIIANILRAPDRRTL